VLDLKGVYDPNPAMVDGTPKLVVRLSEVWTMADPRDLRGLVSLAVEAERAGADGVLIGEHVVMGPTASSDGLPVNARDWYGGWNQDPATPHRANLELLSAIASVTTSLRLLAVGLLTPLRHPLVLAKQLATLDLLSEGRLVFMPTASWHQDEYDAVGVPFEARGAILDEQLEIWKKTWSADVVSHHGAHFDFEGIRVEPKAWRPEGPRVWIGGLRLTNRALRRVVAYGSGFFPGAPPTEEELERLRAGLEDVGRTLDEIELAMWLGRGTPFPDATSTKALEADLDAAAADVSRAMDTVVMKPSRYIDDPAQLGDLCRDAIAGLRERVSTTA
jgi:alkanesulfonate monooxygenase SsuD/methylene tetrahydromethanopterin reductase-like flavin-dependent oxidoreductase (luciferase family)